MTLSLELVLDIHRDQIATYGGESGVRDRAGLESALAQPEMEIFGEVLHPTLPLKAAAFLYHLARNHPFVDGNKRTAWATMETYLLLEGYELTMDDDEAYRLTLDVAAGELDKTQIAAMLERSLVGPNP